MSNAAASNDRVQSAAIAAGTRIAIYGFIATALRDPDAEMARALADPQRRSVWQQTSPPPYADFADRAESLCAMLTTLGDDEQTRAAALLESYTVLFGHAVRGTCPPYELEYAKSDILQRASELADIAGFYEAFGLSLTANGHERADHVVVECEFMSVLTAKEAFAENLTEDAREILWNAQRSFLEDHLGWWVSAFAGRLEKADPDGFYGGVGSLLQAFAQVECRRFDVACGPVNLELGPADQQRDTAFDCGVEELCPGARPCAAGDGAEPFVPLRIDRS